MEQPAHERLSDEVMGRRTAEAAAIADHFADAAAVFARFVTQTEPTPSDVQMAAVLGDLVSDAASAQVGTVDMLDADRRNDLRAGNTPCGTWWRGDVAVTAAVAGSSAVVVRHRPRPRDPAFVCAVEELALAAARTRMRKGASPPDEALLDDLAADAQARGECAVCVRLWPDAIADHRGIHGEGSWAALISELAQGLDALACANGGEAFALGDDFVLLVPEAEAPHVVYAADRLIGALDVGASIGV